MKKIQSNQLNKLFNDTSLLPPPPASVNPKILFPTLDEAPASECDILKIFLWYEIYIYLLDQNAIFIEETTMFNHKLIRLLLLELINAGENLEGIHHATHIPLDILNDIVLELNPNPSIGVSVVIIEYYIMIKRSNFTEFVRRIFQCIAYREKSSII